MAKVIIIAALLVTFFTYDEKDYFEGYITNNKNFNLQQSYMYFAHASSFLVNDAMLREIEKDDKSLLEDCLGPKYITNKKQINLKFNTTPGLTIISINCYKGGNGADLLKKIISQANLQYQISTLESLNESKKNLIQSTANLSKRTFLTNISYDVQSKIFITRDPISFEPIVWAIEPYIAPDKKKPELLALIVLIVITGIILVWSTRKIL